MTSLRVILCISPTLEIIRHPLMTPLDHKIRQQRNLMYPWSRIIRCCAYTILTNNARENLTGRLLFKNEGFQLSKEIADIET